MNLLKKIAAAVGIAVAVVTGGVALDTAQAPPASAHHNGNTGSLHVVSDNFDAYVQFMNRAGIQFKVYRNNTSCCYADAVIVWVAPHHKVTVGSYGSTWSRTEWSGDVGHWMPISISTNVHLYIRSGGW